jgi:small-conductance mechanosensitive channel
MCTDDSSDARAARDRAGVRVHRPSTFGPMRNAARLAWWVLLMLPLLLFAQRGAAQSGFEDDMPAASASVAPSSSAEAPAAPSTASSASDVPAAPSSTTASSAAPSVAPSAETKEPEHEKADEGIVRLKDRKVFSILLERDGKTPMERARTASQALEAAFGAKQSEPRTEKHGTSFTLYLGNTPILDLDEADAKAAGAASLQAYADDVSAKLQSAVAQEQKRSAIASTVFSFSLVVFTALLAFLLFGKIAQLATKAHEWVEDHPEKIPSLRFGGIELARAGAIEGFLTLGISIAKRILQVGVLYSWLIFSLSLFEATKGYTDRLTGLVLGPLSGFVTRIGTALPLALATAIAIFAISLLVRFTGVFFDGVVRGETTLDWVPQDLAAPVGVIVRLGIVVVGLIVAAPLLTGSDEGVLAHAGLATLIAFGLSATPLIACGIVGSLVIFRRRLRPGDFVEVAGRRGRVREVTLLEVAMEDEAGCALRIPHLLSLIHPTRVMGRLPVVAVEIVVDPRASQVKVRDVLHEAAVKANASPRIELVALDVDGALYRVTLGVLPPTPVSLSAHKRSRASSGRAPRTSLTPSVPPPPKIGLIDEALAPTTVELTALLADALAAAGIALGRRSTAESRAT